MHNVRGGQPRGAAPYMSVLLLSAALSAILTALYLHRRLARLVVAGESMIPTFSAGDFLLLDQHAYRAASPAPGDLVLLRDPRAVHRELIKRVIRVDPALGIWVEGDNHATSTDSRTFGWIPVDRALGRIVFRYWPGRPVFYSRARAASRASASSTNPSVGNASFGGSAGS